MSKYKVGDKVRPSEKIDHHTPVGEVGPEGVERWTLGCAHCGHAMNVDMSVGELPEQPPPPYERGART